jgi:hypothetical protein
MKNGEMYRGPLENEKKQGPGIYYWPNGDKFEGQFEDDKMYPCSKTLFFSTRISYSYDKMVVP